MNLAEVLSHAAGRGSDPAALVERMTAALAWAQAGDLAVELQQIR